MPIDTITAVAPFLSSVAPDSAARSELRLPTAEWRCGSRSIPYTIRHSARARCLRLTIRPDTGLVAVVPRGCDARALAQFMTRHQRWIVRQVDELAAIASRIPLRWPYGSTLPYRGEEHRVVVEPASRPLVQRAQDGALRVSMRRPTIAGAKRALKRWYLREALRWCTERTTTLGETLGVSWKRVRVRDQRRRWGSCSVQGHLSFNYRLVMAPPAILDYVVIHELMHRLELNHSRRFWSLVSGRCPSYREAVAWLKTDGAYLGL